MDGTIRGQIDKLLSVVSKASVQSWLKAKEKQSSAANRRELSDLVSKLVDKNEVTFAELQEGIIGIEEAGGKRIHLFEIVGDVTPDGVKSTIAELGLTIASDRKMAKAKARPSLVYVNLAANVLRVKWTEIHKKLKTVIVDDNIKYRLEPVSKIIVLVADLGTKQAQIRSDKPEVIHPHRKAASTNWKESYFAHYVGESRKILNGELTKSDLHNALKQLVESSPSPVRLHRDGHTNQRNNAYRIIARTSSSGDIREDEDWQALYAKGGKTWAHDQHSFYWRPDQSDGLLSREVFSSLDAITGMLRVDADCSDIEVDYAVRKIRELQ